MDDYTWDDSTQDWRELTNQEKEERIEQEENPFGPKPTDEEIEKTENLSNEEIEKKIEQEEIEEAIMKANTTYVKEKDEDPSKIPWAVAYMKDEQGKTHKIGMRYRPKTTRGFTIITMGRKDPLRWIIPALGPNSQIMDADAIEDGFVDDMCTKYQCHTVLVVGNDKQFTAEICYEIEKYRRGEYRVTNIH